MRYGPEGGHQHPVRLHIAHQQNCKVDKLPLQSAQCTGKALAHGVDEGTIGNPGLKDHLHMEKNKKKRKKEDDDDDNKQEEQEEQGKPKTQNNMLRRNREKLFIESLPKNSFSFFPFSVGFRGRLTCTAGHMRCRMAAMGCACASGWEGSSVRQMVLMQLMPTMASGPFSGLLSCSRMDRTTGLRN
jgi:hypothetical protein